MDAFDIVASMDEPIGSKQVRGHLVASYHTRTLTSSQIKLASYLLTILQRIATRLESYYGSLSQESIYRPEIENNPCTLQ
jgi:hypothetical protein